MVRFPELACYLLAGQPKSPRDIVEEAQGAERAGLGTAFISERYHSKEAMALSGAAGAVTQSIRIGTAVTNHNTRHPLVTAGAALTLHGLTGGRFVLGLGRGIAMLQQVFGIPAITTAELEEAVTLLRRLLHGETVVGHDSRLGKYPALRLGSDVNADIPMLLTAFGPNSLALAGRCFDEVVLHTFFTDETTERCVRTVKQAAEQAGRDPADVKVWSCFATIGDHIPEDVRLMKSVGRMATYLQGYGDLMVRTNEWDPAVLERFRGGSARPGLPGRHRSARHDRTAGAHRGADSRGVAGAGGDGHPGAVRGGDPGAARSRLRRGHPARGHADRAGTDSRGLSGLSLRNIMGRLTDRVAIVTGAGMGIGRGIARRFAREGARVALAEFDVEGRGAGGEGGGIAGRRSPLRAHRRLAEGPGRECGGPHRRALRDGARFGQQRLVRRSAGAGRVDGGRDAASRLRARDPGLLLGDEGLLPPHEGARAGTGGEHGLPQRM